MLRSCNPFLFPDKNIPIFAVGAISGHSCTLFVLSSLYNLKITSSFSMEQADFLQLFFYLLPALIVGVVSYYFFSLHIENENKRRLFIIRKENQKQSL